MPHDRYSAKPRNLQHHYARGGTVGGPSSQTKLFWEVGRGLRAEGCISGLVGENRFEEQAGAYLLTWCYNCNKEPATTCDFEIEKYNKKWTPFSFSTAS